MHPLLKPVTTVFTPEELTTLENRILLLIIAGYEHGLISLDLGISLLEVEDAMRSISKKVREPAMREVTTMLDDLQPHVADEIFPHVGSKSVH